MGQKLSTEEKVELRQEFVRKAEAGFEKIAIFVDATGEPTHAARQMGSGMWTSKLGTAHDIAHTLTGVAGRQYGRVGAIVKRSQPSKTR